MKKNLKELKQAYLAAEDITEVKFANENFGSYETWLSFVEKNHNIISIWRKELELKLKGDAYSMLLTTMKEGGKDAVGAAKFLLGKGILAREGDPMVTEEEVKEQVAKKTTRHDDDYLRLIVNKDAVAASRG